MAMNQRKMQMLRVSRESVKRNSDGLMRSEGLVICIRSSDHIPLTTFQSFSCKLSSTCNLASHKPRLCSILQIFAAECRSAVCVSWRQGGRGLPVSCKRWGVDAISPLSGCYYPVPSPVEEREVRSEANFHSRPSQQQHAQVLTRVLRIYLLGKRSAWWGGGS